MPKWSIETRWERRLFVFFGLRVFECIFPYTHYSHTQPIFTEHLKGTATASIPPDAISLGRDLITFSENILQSEAL